MVAINKYSLQLWLGTKLTIFSQATSRDEDWTWESGMMYHRQRHPNGQTEIPNLVDMNLPLPSNYKTKEGFSSLLELNRIYQAMAVKTETELYRRLKGYFNDETGEGNNMGALYWQLNDIWPGASWASVGTFQSLIHYPHSHHFTSVLINLDLRRMERSVEASSLLCKEFLRSCFGVSLLNLRF